MTDKSLSPGERSSDLAAIAADTLLLDTLGNGEPAPADDRVASLLAWWRADLDVDIADFDVDLADLEVALVAAVGTGDAKRRGGRTHRIARRVLGAAAAVLVAGGGLAVGAGHATPGNPLWPLTRVMYPERADNAVAEQTLAQARQAAAEGRHDDARRLLAQAETQIGRLSDPDRAQRLRAELTTVRGTLPAVGPNPSVPAVPTPVPTGAGGSPAAPLPGGGPAPQPTGAVPQPTVTSGAAPGLPPPISVPPPPISVTPPGISVPTVTPPAGGGLLPPLPRLP